MIEEKTYYDNGQLNYHKRFILSQNGELVHHGKQLKYYITGELCYESNYLNGYYHGVVKRYTQTGQIHDICNYNMDRLIGYDYYLDLDVIPSKVRRNQFMLI